MNNSIFVINTKRAVYIQLIQHFLIFCKRNSNVSFLKYEMPYSRVTEKISKTVHIEYTII